MRLEHCIVPAWPIPAGVRALVTTRRGGVSLPPFDSFNLAMHVGDDPGIVLQNRAMLRAILPAEPVWLEQVHGVEVIDADIARFRLRTPKADASVARLPGTVCAVMTADCLPVLFCSADGLVVAAAHAGWRGLVDGVLEATIRAMGIEPGRLLAYLGPAIGPTNFEVGPEVRDRFLAWGAQAEGGFRKGSDDRWFADIIYLACVRLENSGIRRSAIYESARCTVAEPSQLYSYRRDGTTGRMASLIWRELI